MTVVTTTLTPSTRDRTPVLGMGVVAEQPETQTQFLLGTHHANWLRLLDAPLFVSDRTLRRYKKLPEARDVWALDSGGFWELQRYGSWDHGPTPREYVRQVRRYSQEVGNLAWAAPQDWMCEPAIINGGSGGGQHFVGTHLSITEHQQRTVTNYLELRSIAPDLPFIPVLQGYQLADYLACADLYHQAGIDLTTEPLVGLGSVCRRQATSETANIVMELHRVGITRLHGFGVKVTGLRRYGYYLTSADSLAWSYGARRRPPLPGCTTHINCANCPRYAMQWRTRILTSIAHSGQQLDLFATGAAS